MALGGTFRAFIVDATGGLERLEPANVPYVRLDGFIVANTWGQLEGNSAIFAPIDRDEHRDRHQGMFEFAWTGISTGTDEAHCSNWTTVEGGGLVGSVTSSAVAWKAANYERACNTEQRLYCIEQGEGG